MYEHTPVLLTEVLEYLDPRPGDRIIDATLGGGGYAFAIAERVGPEGRVLGLDMDELAINNAKLKIADRHIGNVEIRHANFKDMAALAAEEFGTEPNVAGVVFDLGLSSAQLADRRRGFSFQEHAPLNMAFGSLIPDSKTYYLVNETPADELADMISRFGEERFARPIAKAIVAARREKPITETAELVAAIKHGMPPANRFGSKIHFATRTFQALRIATNGELDNLSLALASLKGVLKPGGKVVIVSFHSLEDRIAKHFLRSEAKQCLCPPEFPVCRCGHEAWLKVLTKKAVTATEEELAANPRSRSAKLRAAQRLTENAGATPA